MSKSVFSHEYSVFLATLRRVRKRSGVSQEEVGLRLKMSQSDISKCERGERRIDVIELWAWCDAMGIGFEDFAAELGEALRGRRKGN